MTPYETMERIKVARIKKWLFAFSVGVPALVVLAVDCARGAVLAHCPEIILTTEGKSTGTVDPGPVVFSVSDIETCEPGTVLDWRWDGRNKTYVVRVEPDAEILKEGFE